MARDKERRANMNNNVIKVVALKNRLTFTMNQLHRAEYLAEGSLDEEAEAEYARAVSVVDRAWSEYAALLAQVSSDPATTTPAN